MSPLPLILVCFLAATQPVLAQSGGFLTAEERSWLAAHPRIRLAPDPDFPPVEFFDEKGAYRGIAAENLALIEKNLGVQFEVQHLKSWDEVIANAKNREADLLGAATETPQRLAYLLFTRPFIELPAVIIVRDRVVGSLTLDDLAGMRVAVVSSYGVHDYLVNHYPRLRLDPVPNAETGLRKVSFGLVDAFVEVVAIASYTIERTGITNLRIAGDSGFVYRLAFAVRSDWPELRSILDKSLSQIAPSQKMAIQSEWIHLRDDSKGPRKEIWLAILGAVTLVTLLVLAANLSLRKLVRRRTRELQKELGERRAAEAALLQSEATLTSILKTAPAGIGMVRGDDLVWVSDPMVEMTGYSREELTSQGSQLLYEEVEESQRVDRLQRQQIHERGLSAIDTRWKRKGGRIIDVHLRSNTLEAGSFTQSIIFTAVDVSDLKRAEQDRKALEAQVQHVQKLESLGLLAGGIAHDFNNILAAVMGNADLALLDLPAGSRVHDCVADIVKASKHAADLCGQMLAYSGKGRFVIGQVDLSRLVREMTHMLEVSTSKKAVVQYHLASDLPSIEADSTQIRQVVMNLVTNASEAVGDRNGLVVISTGTRECDRAYLKETYLDESHTEGLYCFLEVSDTGCGMDEKTRTRIFDPFFTTKFSGRGLGLAAVLGIVRGHRGAIKVYSEPDKGTTVRVLFPACELPASEATDLSRPEEEWRGSGTVLVIDDEESVLQVSQRMLERMGFSVLTARDGRQGIEVFRRHLGTIVCVLLDLTMPQMDGEETLVELRRIRDGVHIILSSGYNEQVLTQRSVGQGLAGFIQKPYRYVDLAAKMSEVLGKDVLTTAGTS
jgi:PAS domain S-box-containing protein